MKENSYLAPYTEEEKKEIEAKNVVEIKHEKSAHHYGAYLILLIIVEYIYNSFPLANFISSVIGRLFLEGIGLAVSLFIPIVFIFWIVDLIRRGVEKRKE